MVRQNTSTNSLASSLPQNLARRLKEHIVESMPWEEYAFMCEQLTKKSNIILATVRVIKLSLLSQLIWKGATTIFYERHFTGTI